MSGSTYTAVSGSWVAPSPTGNSTNTSADASWIGIGGVSTSDLIQVGTENTVSSSGTVSTAAFYELLPNAPIYPTTITITPGDSISAAISEISGGTWSIRLTDVTTSKAFSTTVSYTSSHTSAEWIEEDPMYSSGTLVPFDYFGLAPFSSSSATANGAAVNLTTGSAQAIELVDSTGKPRAVPSVIASDNASFSVQRNNAN